MRCVIDGGASARQRRSGSLRSSGRYRESHSHRSNRGLRGPTTLRDSRPKLQLKGSRDRSNTLLLLVMSKAKHPAKSRLSRGTDHGVARGSSSASSAMLVTNICSASKRSAKTRAADLRGFSAPGQQTRALHGLAAIHLLTELWLAHRCKTEDIQRGESRADDWKDISNTDVRLIHFHCVHTRR